MTRAETRPPDPRRARPRHRRPPGLGLRAALLPFVDPSTSEHVLDPILADLHAQWIEAPSPVARASLYIRFLFDLSRVCAELALLESLSIFARRIGPCIGGATITLSLGLGMQAALGMSHPPTPVELIRPIAAIEPHPWRAPVRNARDARCDELRSWIDEPSLPTRARRLAATAALRCDRRDRHPATI